MKLEDLPAKYAKGECQAVRDVLKTRIDANSSSEDTAIAISVADEFVARSVENLADLHRALIAVDYQFSDPENSLVLNSSPDDRAVTDFEFRMGKIPILATRWYRKIKSVDFSQAYEQLTDRTSPLAGLGWNALLVFQSLEKALEHWEGHCRECEEDDRHRQNAGYPVSGPPTPALLTGGCASNNDCKGFDLPSFRFDDVLYNDGGGDQYFGDEITEAFQCRGFPVLSAQERVLKIVRLLYGEPNIDFLTGKLPTSLRNI